MDAELLLSQKMAESNGLRSRERPNEGMQVGKRLQGAETRFFTFCIFVLFSKELLQNNHFCTEV